VSTEGDIIAAAVKRFDTDAEFHARVVLAANVSAASGLGDPNINRVPAMVALYMASAPLPEPEPEPEWLRMRLASLGLSERRIAELRRELLS
jgi:hypothetical protein